LIWNGRVAGIMSGASASRYYVSLDGTNGDFVESAISSLGSGCTVPGAFCNGTCGVSTSSDPENCGSCGHVCANGERCVAGMCLAEPCASLHCGLGQRCCYDDANTPTCTRARLCM